MNESGITSQYGFLFQRKVFVLYVLENMNVKQRFCFEGKDDVEISADEKIYELDSSESNCVQVKSGVVDQSCFSKVIGNWSLLDSVKPELYTLFIENELKFDLSVENVTNEMLVFVEKGKSKKKTSIARKVYEQYKDDIDNDEAQKLKDHIKNIIDKIKIDKCSIDELDLRLEKIIDSANQPMGVDSFEKVYPVLIEMADEVGIQTIFMSKDKISGIKDDDFIDISEGLNKFHKV